ncbi:zinc knuckle CX2CX4HX4C [Artemisia annua]|uniref:Zinc knuckle CX2CX4HX4C n=1 Tax=Artemisia annua TaxID=35608 RepID=A0A2U1KG77_ARTAN|nr:zinc knuckle CX2CX4HX4C [Artemisia annua]
MVSSIGVPIIMDRMTTSICEKPYGRASFARVLVEIDSSKALVDNVELWYESLGKILRLRVEYNWVPPRCEECKVYGHYLSECANKINKVSKVNKDGESVKAADVTKGNSNDVANNGDGDEGWQTAVNHRNSRGAGYNTRQGPLGGYNVRKGFNNERGGFNNKGNSNVSNMGTRNVYKKSEPVNTGNVGNVDESVIANDRGEPANKGKSKINEGGTSIAVKNINGKDDLKKNMAKNNSSNKNEKVTNKGNKSVKGNKSGNDVGDKDSLGNKCVATSNRFDLLSGDSESVESDLWKEVKGLVVVACNTGVPIAENVLKDWNADMIKFYTVKWHGRTKKRGSVKQQFESEMESLSSQIVQLNRNINNNAKLYANKMLMNSVTRVMFLLFTYKIRTVVVFKYWLRFEDGIMADLDYLKIMQFSEVSSIVLYALLRLKQHVGPQHVLLFLLDESPFFS